MSQTHPALGNFVLPSDKTTTIFMKVTAICCMPTLCHHGPKPFPHPISRASPNDPIMEVLSLFPLNRGDEEKRGGVTGPESCRLGHDWSPGVSAAMAWALNMKTRVPQGSLARRAECELAHWGQGDCLEEGALEWDLDGHVGAFWVKGGREAFRHGAHGPLQKHSSSAFCVPGKAKTLLGTRLLNSEGS